MIPDHRVHNNNAAEPFTNFIVLSCSCRSHHVVLSIELLGQVGHELLEDQRVDVLAQLVQDEPVADLALFGHRLDALERREARLRAQQVEAQLGQHDRGDAVEERNAGDQSHQHEPEPQEHVDLLVDDVQRQHAQTVELLDRTRRTELVEFAFGHFWEDSAHGIVTLLWLQFRHGDDAWTVGGELTAQERVHQPDLQYNVDEVAQLAEEEAVGVVVLRVQIVGEVFNEQLLAVGFTLFVDDGAVHVECEHLDAATLPRLPQVAWHVEEDRLEEQHKAHPLVVLVVLACVLAEFLLTHARVGEVPTTLQHAKHMAGQKFAPNGFSLDRERRSTYIEQNSLNFAAWHEQL